MHLLLQRIRCVGQWMGRLRLGGKDHLNLRLSRYKINPGNNHDPSIILLLAEALEKKPTSSYSLQ